jgi:hypothetical protein
MFNKGILVGTFVSKSKILSFLEFLKNDLNIKLDKVFVYEVNHNCNEYLVTFKISSKVKFSNNLKDSTIIHVKNGCLFSINALNKLIDNENNEKISSNYDYVIDWEKYRNKLVILTKGQLRLDTITKIEDKCVFFK